MKRNFFSLIEMLVVIGLIAILAGLAFPALNSARRKAKENAAVAGCNTLATAIKQFHMTYSKYPSFTFTSNIPIGGGKTGASVDSYENLIGVLCGVTPRTTTGSWDSTNSRHIRFMDPGPEYMKTCDSSNPARGTYANPWGERYYVIWNAGGANPFEFHRALNGSASASTPTVSLLSDVAVFSELDPNSGADYQTGKRLATSWGGIKTF